MAIPLPPSPWFTEDQARPLERTLGASFALALHSQTHWPLYAIEMVDQQAQERGEADVLRIAHRVVVVDPQDHTWDVRGRFSHENWLPVMRAIVSRNVRPEPWVARGYPQAAPMVRRPIEVEDALTLIGTPPVPMPQLLRTGHDRVRQSRALQEAVRQTLANDWD